jgi:hypothetical protein
MCIFLIPMSSKDFKRIVIVKIIIIDYFYENNIVSSCLAQSYILFKYIQSLNIQAKLKKGYIIDNENQIYWGHFWVECVDEIYDIATETFLKYNNNFFRNNKRHLSDKPPLSKEYKCIDNIGFDIIQQRAYIRCINGEFMDDLKQYTDDIIYLKIKRIHDKILKII